ncbi:MAG: GNAT family N-acetyltransferase, partial [Gammaproteobacteria bacterium]|nr:GNAT family N-acetyltransferase [Gammaproteobacteria bacterium]
MNHKPRTTPEKLQLRAATAADIEVILSFIRELADYERLAHLVEADTDMLRDTLFGEARYAEVVIAEYDAEPAGFALFFHNYSTFMARPGLYLEDLYVKPAFRGAGIGGRLLSHLGELAVQ